MIIDNEHCHGFIALSLLQFLLNYWTLSALCGGQETECVLRGGPAATREAGERISSATAVWASSSEKPIGRAAAAGLVGKAVALAHRAIRAGPPAHRLQHRRPGRLRAERRGRRAHARLRVQAHAAPVGESDADRVVAVHRRTGRYAWRAREGTLRTERPISRCATSSRELLITYVLNHIRKRMQSLSNQRECLCTLCKYMRTDM